jgi:uncharacterized protein (TIGR02284 family)
LPIVLIVPLLRRVALVVPPLRRASTGHHDGVESGNRDAWTPCSILSGFDHPQPVSQLESGWQLLDRKRMEQSNRPGEPINGCSHPQTGEVTQVLRGHSFLSGLDEAQLEKLAMIAQQIQFREYELILAAKQRSLYFYLLLSGSVSIELNRGHFAVRIQYLGPGDAFGWSALLEHHDTLFDVRTRECCTAMRLDNKRLTAVLREDPVLAAELLRRTLDLVAGRMLATENRLAEFCGVSIGKPEPEAAEASIRTLNRLIEVCLDGELGYRTAAQHVHSSTLRILLTDRALRRGQYAEELRTEVERLGGNPSHSGSVAASLHRGWIALKSAILGGEAKTIVAACETGEDAARASYRAATNSGFLPSEARSMVEAQSRAIDQSREWLREIRQGLASDIQLRRVPDKEGTP